MTSAVLFLAMACSRAPEEAVKEEAGLIVVTRAQFRAEGMETGDPELKPFARQVRCSGRIVPAVNGHALVSAAIPGVVKKILVRPGQTVRKGEALMEIGGNEVIDLQGDFASTAASLDRLKSEFERIRGLYQDNVSTKKELVQAESVFLAEQAKFSSLRMKLANLGLDPVRVQRGEFVEVFVLRAPIGGRVASVDVTAGQHMEPQSPVAEIIDPGSFQLLLPVFEKDIPMLGLGLPVEFSAPGDPERKIRGVVTSVGNNLDAETKTIDCYAAIHGTVANSLVSNQLVEAVITASADTLPALPEEAVPVSGNEHFVLSLVKETEQSLNFRKIKVETGPQSDGWVAVTLPPGTPKVLKKGLYNLTLD